MTLFLNWCKHCGAALEQRPEKALDGEAQLVWTDVQAGDWLCPLDKDNEHTPSHTRPVAWFVRVIWDGENVTYYGPFTPHEASEFTDSVDDQIGVDGQEDRYVDDIEQIAVNMVPPTYRLGDEL